MVDADDAPGGAPSRHQSVPPERRPDASEHTAELPVVPGRPNRPPADDRLEPEPGPATALTAAAVGQTRSGVSIGAGPLDPRDADVMPARGFRARFAIVYDVDGPRVRLGVGWALLVGGALAYGPARLTAIAVLYAATAGWAALQAATAWQPEPRTVGRWVAAAGAAALPLATAAFGVRGAGGAVVGFVAAAVIVGWIAGPDWRSGAATAERIITCGVWVGLAGAAVVLTLRYEIGAVITLLVLVAVYEASDFIVGSGASNRVEGPLAGIISIAVVTAIVAFLHVEPFEGLDAFAFGALAAVACPIGQFVGSGLLPGPAAHAPALRRLDSLLVLAPLWAWLIGRLLTQHA